MSESSTLWGLHYSPWTEKARWALDHHGLRHRYREHTPLLGEPALRWRSRARPPGRPASVPLLLDSGGVHLDSDEIARRADALGTGASLFPPDHDAALRRWIADADAALNAARAIVIASIASNPQAQSESLPRLIPGPLRGLFRGLARQGAVFLGRKYGSSEQALDAHARTLEAFACSLQEALEGGPYLLAQQFSYADIAAAMVVNGFLPPAHLFVDHPGTRACWTRDALAARYADLGNWRDALYRDHRARIF